MILFFLLFSRNILTVLGPLFFDGDFRISWWSFMKIFFWDFYWNFIISVYHFRENEHLYNIEWSSPCNTISFHLYRPFAKYFGLGFVIFLCEGLWYLLMHLSLVPYFLKCLCKWYHWKIYFTFSFLDHFLILWKCPQPYIYQITKIKDKIHCFKKNKHLGDHHHCESREHFIVRKL